MASLELWLCVDDCGDYGVGKDAASAKENYETDVQALADAGGFRLVKLTVEVPLPVEVELTGAVPAQGQAELSSVKSAADVAA